MQTRRSLFEELSQFSGSGLENRAENACTVAVKFMALLREETHDDKSFDLMMKAWFRAVKDDDIGKFKRTYRKYKDGDSEK